MTLLSLILLLLSNTVNAETIQITATHGNVNLTMNKVVRLTGIIIPRTTDKFIKEYQDTSTLSGDRLIIINSPGGEVRSTIRILDVIKQEKSKGVKIFCIATRDTSSMAFNIFSHCDVRFITPKTLVLTHKIGYMFLTRKRYTAIELKKLALELENSDKFFDKKNAEELHLSLDEYNQKAIKETIWLEEELIERNYINGIVKFKRIR